MKAVALILAGAMAIAAVLNLRAPRFVRAEFARWGYPSSLRIAVGVVEAAAAVMLLFPSWRARGAALALAVLAGVIATLLRDRAWLRLEYPVVLAVLALLVLRAA
ncbi:DoxX family protein [Falsiroseomonas sp. HW251]|uniref:DoxX family protein n=1 Tax=Falsiroseomonas sp. HW251 TaxID=3390998 RepID=UPI003D3143F0